MNTIKQPVKLTKSAGFAQQLGDDAMNGLIAGQRGELLGNDDLD